MDVLKNDFADVLKQKLDDVYRSSSKTGGITDKEGRLDFIVGGPVPCHWLVRNSHSLLQVYLNDLQVSNLALREAYKGHHFVRIDQ